MIGRSPSSNLGRRSRLTVAVLLVVLPAVALPPAAAAQAAGHWVGTWAAGLQAQAPPDPASGQDPVQDLFGPLGARAQSDAAADRAGDDRRLPPAGRAQQRLRHAAARGRRRPTRPGAPPARPSSRAAGQPSRSEAGPPSPSRRARRSSATRSTSRCRTSGTLPSTCICPATTGSRARRRRRSAAPGRPATSPPPAITAARCEMPVEATLRSWLYLSRVEVAASAATRVVVTLGDLHHRRLRLDRGRRPPLAGRPRRTARRRARRRRAGGAQRRPSPATACCGATTVRSGRRAAATPAGRIRTPASARARSAASIATSCCSRA